MVAIALHRDYLYPRICWRVHLPGLESWHKQIGFMHVMVHESAPARSVSMLDGTEVPYHLPEG